MPSSHGSVLQTFCRKCVSLHDLQRMDNCICITVVTCDGNSMVCGILVNLAQLSIYITTHYRYHQPYALVLAISYQSTNYGAIYGEITTL